MSLFLAGLTHSGLLETKAMESLCHANIFGNLCDLTTEVGHRIFEVSQKNSMAIKNAYQCASITLRQNNEPAGDQHTFHYHLKEYLHAHA